MSLISRARDLRTHATIAEIKLWSRLKKEQMGVKCRRQQPIGPYVVDFFCPTLKLVVEVDGGQHTIEIDAPRTGFLKREGYSVCRYWNNEVLKNIDGVLFDLAQKIQVLSPPPAARAATSPLKGEV